MQSNTLHTATSYTDVSYHSSDDELDVTSTNEEGEVYEEVTEIDEDEVSDESYHEEEEEAEHASSPVKSNAPVPLHQLLAAKLKNTNIKLSEPKTRSVKEMAAAFAPPRPTSFTRRNPIESAPPPWANKQLKKVEKVEKEPEPEPPAPSSPIQVVRRKQPPPAAALPVPKKRAMINIKGKPMKKPQPREVDKMEKLSEGGSADESSSSVPVSEVSERHEPSSSSSSEDEVSISEVNDNSEHPSRQPQIIPSKKSRKYDGTVDGDSSSSGSSSSSYSFSVSSGTDESLAAKLGDLGTPFAPMPIAANFIPEDTNHEESASSSSNSPTGTRSPDEGAALEGTFGLERQVSWSDLLGDGNQNEDRPRASSVGGSPGSGGDFQANGGDDDDDDDDETSYESYETASSDEEFETDTERDVSQMAGPPDVYLAELNADQESPATSDYETDTSYERIHAEAEGRTPPPPKKPIVPFHSPRQHYAPMPMVNENAISEDWSDEEDRRRRQQQDSFYAKRGRRRKPFEDVPTAVAAELKQVSKNDPAMTGGGGAPLGITGWDGENGQGSGNCFDRIFKKKGDGEVKNIDELPPIPLPESPMPYDPPDYDNDEDDVSNITDRVFSPKKPTPEQDPLDAESETSESQRSRDNSGRFSITKFRRSNSARNTERALEGLKVTSIEPKIVSKYNKQKRNIPALLNMQNEAVDFYVPREHDSITQTTGDFDDDRSPTSHMAYDSRDVETPRMENDLNYDYDPMRTEIVEERYVGYADDDGDYASHSRYEFNDEEYDQERAPTQKYGGDKKNTPITNVDETLKPRKSRRLGCITCIVICNLLLLLGLGTWLLLEYFYLQEGSSWPWQGRPAIPSSKSGEIKAELVKILKPNLPDGESVFNDETSPQSEALDWMINDPYIHTYDEEKISIRFALATFYYSTEGDSWTTNHLWLSDLDECLWYTSSTDSPCTGEGRFSRLVLTDNNLQGQLPRELSVLSNNLVSLDVDGTFTGEIPSNVGDLAKLTTLRLSGRVLSGQIPSSLYTLSDLSTLDLGQNLLSGELSWAIVKMSDLKSMSLMGNHLIGSFPKEIGQLTGLTHFNIDDNYFDNISHEAIGRLSKLEILSMRNNVLKGSLPSTIGNSLTNLKGLFLNNNEYTGSIPDSYGNLSNLETGLDLSSNKLTGTVPESLGQLSILQNLLLRDNGLSGTIPLSWGKLSVLRTLRLDSTNFEGELPTQVCDSFNEAYSSYYVDCWKLDCPCCNFCCDGGECICRFADSLPILCVEP